MVMMITSRPDIQVILGVLIQRIRPETSIYTGAPWMKVTQPAEDPRAI